MELARWFQVGFPSYIFHNSAESTANHKEWILLQVTSRKKNCLADTGINSHPLSLSCGGHHRPANSLTTWSNLLLSSVATEQ